MQPIYFADFTFVYISKKNTLFRGRNRPMPFLDIYFCPKRKNQTTFGKWYFCVLYILLIFILKETYTIPFYIGYFFQLVTSTGAIAGVTARHYTAGQRNYIVEPYYVAFIEKPEMSDVTRYRSRFYSHPFLLFMKKNIYKCLYFFGFIFFIFYVFYFLFFMFYVFYVLCFYKSSSSSSSSNSL